MACGPPSAVISSGIVMNGPMPIMLIMFSAVACSSPKRRCSGAADGAVDVVGVVMVGVHRSPVLRLSRARELYQPL